MLLVIRLRRVSSAENFCMCFLISCLRKKNFVVTVQDYDRSSISCGNEIGFFQQSRLDTAKMK